MIYHKDNKNSDTRKYAESIRNKIMSIAVKSVLHRGSYMSAHVLLTLLNELGEKVGFPRQV